jgi:predicted polyphosphate/ATP-dependent NAD kinase
MRTVGFVLNPIAGMGGRVGLKGTDGKVEEARELGAKQRAPDRAREALARLAAAAPDVAVLTWGGPMGAEAAREAGIDAEVLGHPEDPDATSAEDTRAAVRAFLDRDVDLVLFVGGDGTAVDVLSAIEAASADVPMLGVPAGVKVYSSVFAVTPREAGRVAAEFERTREREVNDIDENAYREEGEVHSALQGVASVPVAEAVQSGKQLSGGSVESLAAGVAADVEPGVTYAFGPGGTVGAIERELGFEGSPLGVDVWRDGELLVADASEDEILAHLGEENLVVVSPIGGQGFVFGRGNHQLSPAVLRRSEVQVVADREKLDDVCVLRVDLDDEAVADSLRGWRKVRVGRFERRMMQVV